jgi:hypothetical protein
MIPPVVSLQSTFTLFLARQADTGRSGGEMSRQLPPHPNLEYLRNQAKELLEALQRQDPSAQLADAQHALAREYGCSSWPALKTRVEQQLAAYAQTASLFAGAWSADVAKSQRHPLNPFQSATIVFEVDGNDLRMSDVVVDEAGREERHVNTIRVDGRERSAEPRRGYRVRASWRDPYTLETVGIKDGQPIGGATYAVSPDGQTLTISADQQLIVLERVSTA